MHRLAIVAAVGAGYDNDPYLVRFACQQIDLLRLSLPKFELSKLHATERHWVQSRKKCGFRMNQKRLFATARDVLAIAQETPEPLSNPDGSVGSSNELQVGRLPSSIVLFDVSPRQGHP